MKPHDANWLRGAAVNDEEEQLFINADFILLLNKMNAERPSQPPNTQEQT